MVVAEPRRPPGRPRKAEKPQRRKRGTGSIVVTGDRAYALDVRDQKGHREPYEGRGDTLAERRRDAERWLDGRVADRKRAAGLLPETFGSFIDRWIVETYSAAPGSTYMMIRSRLKRAEPLYTRGLATIGLSDIEKLTADLLKSGLAPSYVRGIRVTLKKAFAAAVKRGLIASNPVETPATPIRVPVRQQVVWEQEAIDLFLSVARRSRWGMLWVLALGYGLRQGELRALQWPDIDLRRRRITVRRNLQPGRRAGGTKSHVERVIVILPEIAAALRAYRLSPWSSKTWCFTHTAPDAMTSHVLSAEFSDLIAETNAAYPAADGDPPRLAPLTPHGLRHTAATALLRRGVPVVKVSKILGHSKVSITWDMYGWCLPSDDDLVDQAVKTNLLGGFPEGFLSDQQQNGSDPIE